MSVTPNARTHRVGIAGRLCRVVDGLVHVRDDESLVAAVTVRTPDFGESWAWLLAAPLVHHRVRRAFSALPVQRHRLTVHVAIHRLRAGDRTETDEKKQQPHKVSVSPGPELVNEVTVKPGSTLARTESVKR